MADSQTVPSDFEAIWQAVKHWLPARQTTAYQAGLLGAMVRGRGHAPLAGDLTHLLIPGLAALGVEALLVPFSSEERERLGKLNEDSAHVLLGFAAQLSFSPPPEIDDATPVPGDTDPIITAQTLFSAEISEVTPEALRARAVLLSGRFSHILRLRRSAMKSLRRENIASALHRWLAWHAAYPGRTPREGDRTDPACALAAAFLREAVGTRRDFASNRLRYAADCFEDAEIEAAYAWLLEAGIALWQLPAATAEALLTAPDQPLPDTLRWELIYLARAGTLPLKTLAVRRLVYERRHVDARKTLHQLCFDPAPWVRAAAHPSS